ncbi:hypothetical protein [Clostridium brassicae]|uniref:Helix-turn-helix domain-containing protein n=1 Tax=Clostridium brassicae TaxID=2999072 RepID=A0ABT4DCE1_9CLOT|nr:hypothetical protein [Clostridium brassicae]MCY6958896.1 hypothetical protein [Clostridium brassicae]
MSNGFTKIDNEIIESESLSFEAKGVYMTLARFISIPNFKINKMHVKSVTGLGEIRFNRAWKELKENKILIQKKKSVNGKFQYEYTLKNKSLESINPKIEKIAATVKEHVDNDGNVPLKGQMSVDDVLQNKEEDMIVTHEDVKKVVQETEFNDVQAKELLKVARNDVTKVIKAYKYTIHKKGIKNIYAYSRWIIKNNNVLSISSGPNINGPKVDSFNNYHQRIYDYEKLEMALLYGESYELPI